MYIMILYMNLWVSKSNVTSFDGFEDLRINTNVRTMQLFSNPRKKHICTHKHTHKDAKYLLLSILALCRLPHFWRIRPLHSDTGNPCYIGHFLDLTSLWRSQDNSLSVRIAFFGLQYCTMNRVSTIRKPSISLYDINSLFTM